MSKNKSGLDKFFDNVSTYRNAYDQGVRSGKAGGIDTSVFCDPVKRAGYDAGLTRGREMRDGASNSGGSTLNYSYNSYDSGSSSGSGSSGCLSVILIVVVIFSVVLSRGANGGSRELSASENGGGQVVSADRHDHISSENSGGQVVSVNRRARISSEVNAVAFRRTPGYRNKPDNDVMSEIESGNNVVIVGGSVQVDGVVWWKVRWNNIEGWVAQNRSSGAKILEFSQYSDPK